MEPPQKRPRPAQGPSDSDAAPAQELDFTTWSQPFGDIFNAHRTRIPFALSQQLALASKSTYPVFLGRFDAVYDFGKARPIPAGTTVDADAIICPWEKIGDMAAAIEAGSFRSVTNAFVEFSNYPWHGPSGQYTSMMPALLKCKNLQTLVISMVNGHAAEVGTWHYPGLFRSEFSNLVHLDISSSFLQSLRREGKEETMFPKLKYLKIQLLGEVQGGTWFQEYFSHNFPKLEQLTLAISRQHHDNTSHVVKFLETITLTGTVRCFALELESGSWGNVSSWTEQMIRVCLNYLQLSTVSTQLECLSIDSTKFPPIQEPWTGLTLVPAQWANLKKLRLGAWMRHTDLLHAWPDRSIPTVVLLGLNSGTIVMPTQYKSLYRISNGSCVCQYSTAPEFERAVVRPRDGSDSEESGSEEEETDQYGQELPPPEYDALEENATKMEFERRAEELWRQSTGLEVILRDLTRVPSQFPEDMFV